MELPAGELALGGLDVLAQLDEAEREAAGADPKLLGARGSQLLLLPALVRILQRGGQTHELAPVERRQAPPDLELTVALHLAEVELADASERPHEGGVAPALVAQAEGARGVGQREVEACGARLQPRGQAPEQPGGRRAEYGVTLAVARKLIEQGRIPRDEEIVLCVTGNGLKTQDAIAGVTEEPAVIKPSLEAFEAVAAGEPVLA